MQITNNYNNSHKDNNNKHKNNHFNHNINNHSNSNHSKNSNHVNKNNQDKNKNDNNHNIHNINNNFDKHSNYENHSNHNNHINKNHNDINIYYYNKIFDFKILFQFFNLSVNFLYVLSGNVLDVDVLDVIGIEDFQNIGASNSRKTATILVDCFWFWITQLAIRFFS